ncbi:Sulfur carrier protein ThiS adenylyltransferase [Azoarcus sp. Aa7]|nr:Sulfur carrier protein ThiS adenylyltransferase [Azoarcus sp. Aa7]
MITPGSCLRLRPSVAMVPMGAEQWQFFQGNTRRSRVFRLRADLADAVGRLNGEQTLAVVARNAGAEPTRLVALAESLHTGCLIEDAAVAQRIAQSPWRRLLNFVGDYIPSDVLESILPRLSSTSVIILGVGGVGSWVAAQLCQFGFGHLVLVDNDTVEQSNLNRSLYSLFDVGRHKVDALADHLRSIRPEMQITCIKQRLSDAGGLAQLLAGQAHFTIVVNCADMPSVDVTSAMVDAACRVSATPYVIAGGYNLHLSLVGMTVLPGTTACYHCGRLTLEEKQGDDLAGMRKLARPWRNIGNLAPLAAITASFAANEVIRVAISDSRIPPAMTNRRGEFNFLTNEMHFVSLPLRPECGCTPQ